MALTPQNNDAFVREVDDELRRDRMKDIWQKWGVWLVAALIAALAAFGGWMYWQHSRTVAAGEQGERFTTALDNLGTGGKEKAAPVLAELAEDGTPGYRAMALMTQADIALAEDDLPRAAQLFGTIAGDGALPQPVRDLALIRQTTAQFDTLQPGEVIARMRPLAVAGNPYLGSAGELTAAAHLRAGQNQQAGAMYALIARDEGVPETLRSRSVQMAGVLGVDAVSENEDDQAQ